MKKIITTTLFVFSVITGFSQIPPHRTCGTMDYHNYLMQTRPNYATDYTQYNQMIDQYIQNNQGALNTAAKTANITIPVVIHVLYNTATQNISDAQAISQFAVLNNDFQRLNADKVNTPSTFTAVAGGVGITFCLAQRTPSGTATTGVIHKSTTLTSFTTDNKIKFSAQGGDDAWDVTKYINIWIGNISGGILGYGEFPTTSLSNTYGLVLNYTATGTSGTAAAPYNLGRTGTHEFGHCFNLNHIWGDNGQCGNTDNCYDTPPQKGGTNSPAGCNYGTPTYPWQPNTCTRPDGIGGASMTNVNGDMFMNYMDYTDDAVMNMFTQQQCVRMLAVVSNAPWNVLASSNGCTPVTSYSLDAGISSIIKPANAIATCINSVTPSVVLTNAGSSTLTSAKVLYKMDAAATQTLNWTGSLATNANATLTLNAYTGLTSAAHTFSVWVTAPNGGVDQGSTNDSQSSTFTVTAAAAGAALPFTEGFEATTFPPTGWILQKANTISATNTWSRVANTTGLTAGSTAIALMDNFSGNTNIAGQLDALQSPALTFTSANTSLNLSFDVAHRVYNTTQIDTLNVYISSDCGTTWTRLYSKGGTQLANSTTAQTTAFTPTANTQWRRESVSLSSYVGLPSVYVKFESRSGYGNNVCLDNINISYTTTSTIPVANFSVSATKCVGSPITFTDLSTNAPTSWAWSFPGGTPSTSTSQNPSVTYTAAGTYTATLLSANSSGTSTPITQTISINALPSVVATSTAVCVGSTAVLTATGASTYSWSTGATTSTISVTPTTNTSYTVTGTATTGCTNTAVGSVTVSALPIIAVTSATTCAGNSKTLTASGASTYSWSTGATTSTMSASTTTNTSYTVTGTTATGCKNTAVGTISVTGLPTVVATSTAVCMGSSAVLIASGASTYSWSTGATTSTISAIPTTNTTYTVTGTATTGCTNTAVGSVTVNVLPAVSASSTTICAGSGGTLTASGASTYTWSTGTNGANLVVSPTSNTNYTVTGTSVAGCIKSATATIVVGSAPIITVNSSTICVGSTATLSASGVNSYTWNTGANTSAITVNPSSTTVYTVSGNLTGCTTTASQTATVTVLSLPIVAATSTVVCAGNTAVLTASGASSYLWNTGATTSTISATPTTNTSYTLTGTSTTGCKNTAVGSVTVNALPTVVATNTSICAGSAAVLTASGASSYLWNTSATTSTISVTPTANTSYTVTGTSTTGCTNTAVGSVTVNALPIVAATSATTCAGNIALLQATGASTYSWNTGVTTSTISATPTTNTSYTVTGIATTGCKNTAVGNVTVSALPIVVVTSATTCIGNSKTLTASGASTYSWSSGVTTSTMSATPTTNTSYTVTGTATSGCKNTAVGTISVTSLPIVIATNTNVCIGNSAVLTASGASTYLWSIGATTSTISATPTTNTSYTVTGTATTGCKNTAVGSVTVNALPNVTATSATICAGSAGTLTASGASTYSWSTGATGSNLVVSPTSNTSYTVTGTATTGCVKSATATIVVGSAPVITVNSSTICAGSTAILSASGVNSYTWNTSANTSAITANPSSTTVYTVSGSLAGCTTGASQTATVTVNALPVVSLAPISQLCVNSSAVMLMGSPSSGTYTGTGVSGSTFDPTVSGAGTFTVTYYYTDINNCSSSVSQPASVSLCTGIAEAFNESSISIYPNPAKDVVFVNLNTLSLDNTTIELYDTIGKLVVSQKVVDTISTLSLADLVKGIYSIRIITDSHQVVKRIIKE
jgi:hypothetical protein